MKLNNINMLQLIKTFDVGGIERSTLTYANYLSKFINRNIIVGREGFFYHNFHTSENTELKILPNKFDSDLINIITNSFYILRLIKHEKINMVFYHHRVYLPIIYLIHFLFPCIRICYIAHSTFNDFINHLLIADYNVAVSRTVAESLIKYRFKNITIIKHGVIINTKKNRKHTDFNLGYVGRLTNGKGLQTLFESYRELLDESCNVGKLILSGDGKLRTNLWHIIDYHDLETRVELRKPEVDLYKMYDEIDILIVPSERLEGFGLSIAEAMSFGIPVVASDLPAHKEIIQNGKNGFLFEINNINELKEKISALTTNHNLYRDISSNAYNYIIKEINIESTIHKYLKLLEQV